MKPKLMMVSFVVISITVISLQFFTKPNQTPTGVENIPGGSYLSVSAFSKGVRLEVTVNNTNPSIGDVVGIEASITNINSTERVFWGGPNLVLDILNSHGVRVYGLGVLFTQPTLPVGPVELTKNETYSDTVWWRVETSPDFNVEVKSGETYYITVTCKFKTDTGDIIKLSTEPIRVTTK